MSGTSQNVRLSFWNPNGVSVRLYAPLRAMPAANLRLVSCGGVDRRELAGEVVLEQVLVVVGLDQILEGRGRRRFAVGLLDVGAGRHSRHSRGRSAVVWDH